MTIHFVGHCDLYFMVPYICLFSFNIEGLVPLRHALLSSDNWPNIRLKKCEIGARTDIENIVNIHVTDRRAA